MPITSNKYSVKIKTNFRNGYGDKIQEIINKNHSFFGVVDKASLSTILDFVKLIINSDSSDKDKLKDIEMVLENYKGK